jgi:predicted DNA repair protein MutK
LGSIPLEVSLALRSAILVLVGLIITIGVYGFVALIVKLDDIGFWLAQKYKQGFRRTLGKFLILAAPQLMKFLTFMGTAAMFIVGGGILAHGIPWAGRLTETLPLGSGFAEYPLGTCGRGCFDPNGLGCGKIICQN